MLFFPFYFDLINEPFVLFTHSKMNRFDQTPSAILADDSSAS